MDALKRIPALAWATGAIVAAIAVAAWWIGERIDALPSPPDPPDQSELVAAASAAAAHAKATCEEVRRLRCARTDVASDPVAWSDCHATPAAPDPCD